MDKRLQLTEAQMRLVFRFNDLLEEMEKNDILFVENEGNIYVVNGEKVESYLYPEDLPEYDEEEDDVAQVRFEDMEITQMGLFYWGAFMDDSMGFNFGETH